MKKFVTLILVSFTLLFCFSFAVFAAEREATGEEISAVKSGLGCFFGSCFWNEASDVFYLPAMSGSVFILKYVSIHIHLYI